MRRYPTANVELRLCLHWNQYSKNKEGLYLAFFKILSHIKLIIIHQTYYKKIDRSRTFNEYTRGFEIVVINKIYTADISLVMSSSYLLTQTWVLMIHDIMLNLINNCLTLQSLETFDSVSTLLFLQLRVVKRLMKRTCKLKKRREELTLSQKDK